MRQVRWLYLGALFCYALYLMYLDVGYLLAPLHFGFLIDYGQVHGFSLLSLAGLFLGGAALLRLRQYAGRPIMLLHLLMLAMSVGLVMLGLDLGVVFVEEWAGVFMLALLALPPVDAFFTAKEDTGGKGLTAAVLVAAVGIFYVFFPGGDVYYDAPASAHNTSRIIHVDGGEPKGTILGLSVRDGEASPFVTFMSFFRSEIYLYEFDSARWDGEEDDEELPELPAEEEDLPAFGEDWDIELRHMMDRTAAAVALEYLGLGKGANLSGEGVWVDWVVPGAAAEGHLFEGDLIIGVKEQQVRSGADLRQALMSHPPGEPVILRFMRGDRLLERQVPTGFPEEGEPHRAVLGVMLREDLEYDIPVDIRFTARWLAGDSMGAMITVAIIDQLTPGGVTNGHIVAGTGTIDADGYVGMVGGVPQKAYLAEKVGATVLFVPVEHLEEAQELTTRLTIVPVQHFTEILEWLESNPRR